jgi:hypothetical protein
MQRFIRDNSLSLVLFGLFFASLAALSLAGVRAHNNELSAHSEPAISYVQYLRSGTFVEAVFENWESEFLQMGAFVVLTMWFKQKGSKDSKKLHGNDPVDVPPRYSLFRSPWPKKPAAFKEALYAHSLSLALFGLFFISFVLHAMGGAAAYNAEATAHHESPIGTLQYVGTSQFWFESFQNWQSEFLAVGALIVFTIFLRERYSPESKPIGEPNTTTGGK